MTGLGGLALAAGATAGAWAHAAQTGARQQARLADARPVIYTAIGASDAAGFGVRAPQREGWVPLLAGMLPQPTRLVNLGVPGSTLRRALEQQVPLAIQAQPHLITIWLVVNDVLEGVPVNEYAGDLGQLLGRLRESTKALIAIGNAPYPPASLDPWHLPEVVRRGAALAWNSVIHSAASQHGALVVDLYKEWPIAQHPEFIGPDGLHPTALGYRALSQVFDRSLRAHGAY
jgi:lysophospholipase L1-like esterase